MLYSQEIIETGKKLLQMIHCDYGEVRLNSTISTSIVLSGEETESLSSGDSIGGSLRILKNGSWNFISFNDIEKLESFIKRGEELTTLFKTDNISHITKSEPIISHHEIHMDTDFRAIPIQEKHTLIDSYNKILRSAAKIQTTRATYRDVYSEYSYINTDGSHLTYNKAYCGIALVSVAKDGTVIQPFHDSVSGYGGYEIVQNRENNAEKVVKTATDLLTAESVSGGQYDVVVDPKLAGVFAHEAFGHLSEADFIHENKRMKEIMVLGKRFGPDHLNIIDDGTMEGLSGYIPFDDEGIMPQKTYLIKDGILTGRLHSRETSQKLDEELTGNARAIGVMKQPIVRMTNTYIDNGSSSPDELFDGLADGIYAIDALGGQTNLEMFTFSAGYGYEIKNGKKGKMLKDIVLSGNVFKTLHKIKKVANDRIMFGGLGGCGKGGQSPLPVSLGSPHILISDVLIGGNQ